MPTPAPAHRAAGHHAGALRRHAAGHHRAPGGYARELGAALAGVADVEVGPPARDRDDAERVVADFERQGLDGLLVVMLTYGPGDARRARAARTRRLPICLANIQPVPGVTPAWDMADLTYNQGIHGAQDTANAMVRAGRPFHVVTDDWHAGLVRRGGRALGARGRGGHALARAQGRRLRLRDERDGRHPRRRPRAAARARAAGRRARARRAAPRRAGRQRRRRARADGRARTRASRSTRALSAERARGPRAHAARHRGACCARAATAPTRRTSTRSARTAASRACRWRPPRASWPRATATAPRATR